MQEETLTLQGIIYPPAQSASNTRTLAHLCEEFDLNELQEQLQHIEGLPISIEHDMSKLIGSVTKAELTHSGAVQVTAVVNASSDVARRAIQDIKDKKLTGLSLSHEYNLFAKDGCPLQITLDSNGDWRDLLHKKGESVAVKQMRELSVCREPARSGCYIHTLPEMSGVHGLVNACKKGSTQQVSTSINGRITPEQQSIDKLCFSLWNIVNRSANMDDQNTPTQNTTQTVAADPPVPCEPTLPDQAPTNTATAQGDADPASVTQPLQPTSDTQPVNEEIPPQNDKPANDNAIKNPESTTAEMQNEVQSMLKSAGDALTHERESLNQAKSELADVHKKLKIAEDTAKRRNEQLEEAAARDTARAQAETKDVLNRLRQTMQEITGGDGSKVEIHKDTEIKDLATKAIYTMNQLKNDETQAKAGENMLKRQRHDIQDALTKFSGNQPQVGTVNASAKSQKVQAGDNASQNKDSPETEMRTWMQNNPNALQVETQRQWMNLHSHAQTHGIVNASSAMWKAQSVQNNAHFDPLSAKVMQPEMYHEMSKQMKGRSPNADELSTMIKSISTHKTGPYR